VIGEFPSQEHAEALYSTRGAMDMDVDFYHNQGKFVDWDWTMGNYVADKEGNVIMDLNASSSGHVLGYKHDMF
jgi:4-aminobutyrate aminotransferase-like enzyme